MRSCVGLFIASILVSCGPNDNKTAGKAEEPPVVRKEHVASPEETVKQLISAYLDKRLGEYYSLVATVDRKAKSLEELQEEFAPSSSDLVTDYLFQNTRFRIDSTSVDGDSALVYVTSDGPEVGSVVEQATVVERSLGASSDFSTKMSVLNERLRLNGGPRVENHATYFLVREPDGWRAVIGWADEKAFERQMRADSSQAGGT